MRTGAGWFANVVLFFLVMASAWNAGCGSGKAPDPLQEAEGAPADQNVGERIFVDTRFAEYFAENMTGVNDPLAVGDPVVAQVSTPIGMLPGPFAGESIRRPVLPFRNGIHGRGRRAESYLSRIS